MSLQLPMRAKSWLATIQPIPLTDIMYLMHCKSSWIVLTKTMDLSRAPHYFLLKELQAVKQFVELKAYPLRTRELLQLSFHFQRPLATCGSGGKIKPLKKQQRFDALLVATTSLITVSRSCTKWRSSR